MKFPEQAREDQRRDPDGRDGDQVVGPHEGRLPAEQVLLRAVLAGPRDVPLRVREQGHAQPEEDGQHPAEEVVASEPRAPMNQTPRVPPGA